MELGIDSSLKLSVSELYRLRLLYEQELRENNEVNIMNPNEMDYEESLGLEERIGKASRGLTSYQINVIIILLLDDSKNMVSTKVDRPKKSVTNNNNNIDVQYANVI